MGKQIYKVSAMDTESPQSLHRNEKGIHWVVAAIFIVGDMAGGGLVAMPIAMVDAGLSIGIVCTILGAVISGYTGIQLGDNWILMQDRWEEYRTHCRNPYPEMAFRALGPRARNFVQFVLCITQFGIAVVFLLLAAKNLSNFLDVFFAFRVDFCILIIVVSLILLPFIMLKSPKDFWQAAVGAALSTSIAVVLLIIGSVQDIPTCKPKSEDYPSIEFSKLFLAYGTIMFAYGGHGVFPTIQHDMKKPYRFNRSVWLAYIIIVAMYLPVSVVGYEAYGGSLKESIIPSVQTIWIQQTVNIMITLHVMLTVIIIFSPLSQGAEQLFNAPHKFGWQRFTIRAGCLVAVAFVAESVPHFGVFLDLVGGSTITLMTMLLPSIFYLFLFAAKKKREEKIYNKEIAVDSEDNEFATIRDIIKFTPKPLLCFNIFCLVFGCLGGIAASSSAIAKMLSSGMDAPCYVRAFRSGNLSLANKSGGTVHCCGPFSNLTSIPRSDGFCASP